MVLAPSRFLNNVPRWISILLLGRDMMQWTVLTFICTTVFYDHYILKEKRPCAPLQLFLWVWQQKSKDTRERKLRGIRWRVRGGKGWGGRAGGESSATVITNKNHLSHLCNLFSFNMRTMPEKISEFERGQGEGWFKASLILESEQLALISSQPALLTLQMPHGCSNEWNTARLCLAVWDFLILASAQKHGCHLPSRTRVTN